MPSTHSKAAPARPATSLFHAFHGSLPIAAFWKDPQLRLQEANPRFIQLFGLADDHALRGSREDAFLSPADAEIIRYLDQHVLATGEPVLDHELAATLPDGRIVALLTSRSLMLNASGATIGILATYQDLTQQRATERQILDHQRELEQRNQAIEFDLDSAQQIQKFLMGRRAEPCPFLKVQFRYRYMEKVGGDYVSLRAFDDSSYSMLLADLTGHGVTAALFMALIKYISKEAPEEVRSLPAYFLSYLDMEFFGQIPNGFFTAFSATARHLPDSNRVELEYASAAHPVGIIVRRDGSFETLQQGDFAIGLLDFVERESHKIQLATGDRLYAYTDGFTEAASPQDEEFGLARLAANLAEHRHLPLRESIDALYQAVDSFTGSDLGQDDMTILAIEAVEHSPAPDRPTEPLQDWAAN